MKISNLWERVPLLVKAALFWLVFTWGGVAGVGFVYWMADRAR